MVKFLFVGDLHLRGTNPRNRIDDYKEAAKQKLKEVFKIAVDNAVDAILQPGDIFDRPEVGIAVLLEFAEVLKESPVNIYCTLGNHDIYGYNVDSYYRTSLRLLEMLVPQLTVIRSASDKPIYLAKGHYKVYLTATPYSKDMDINGYGYGPDVDYPEGNRIGVHIAHGMLLDHRPPFDRYSDLYKVDTTADIILTGHDHLGYGIYHRSADDKLFVNPGSLLRMSASVNEMERQIRVALIKIDEISGKYEAGFTASRYGHVTAKMRNSAAVKLGERLEKVRNPEVEDEEDANSVKKEDTVIPFQEGRKLKSAACKIK